MRASQANALLIGLVATNQDDMKYNQGGDFRQLARVTGHSVGFTTLYRTFRIVSTTGSYSATGALSADAADLEWTAALVAYPGARQSE